MKDREINVEIAITQGWKPKEMAQNGERWLFWRTRKDMTVESQSEPPNYCEDATLIEEAELTLRGLDKWTFKEHLKDILRRDKCKRRTPTPRQRAEAYLLTLDAWQA